MRIGIVCPYSLTAPGGVQDQVVGLAHALGALGHDAEVIAPGRLPAAVRGTSAGRAIGFRVNGSVAPMAPHPRAMLRTAQVIRRGAWDVVHLHEPFAPSITVAALLASRVPIVATFHAAGERTPYRHLGSSLSGFATRIAVRVAVSETAARLAARHLGGTYEVFGNGIDPTKFGGSAPPGDRRRGILFLGRHEPRKGLRVLLEAAAGLPSDVEVWIAGHGPETDGLRARHGDPRIRWLGMVDDESKIRLLRSAAVLCAPSLHGESFGMVLLEAMAAGAPVVASDIAGYRDLAHGGAAARLVPPGDPERLAAALRGVLADATYAEQLRVGGAAQTSRHTMTALARRYVAVYEQLGDEDRDR